jgi:hypothetical protein
LAFGRVDRVVVAVLDIQTANATVHLTDSVMLPARTDSSQRVPPLIPG